MPACDRRMDSQTGGHLATASSALCIRVTWENQLKQNKILKENYDPTVGT